MFAGPNGSGKSTIKAWVEKSNASLLGIYINPDDIERDIADSGSLKFANYKIETNANELFLFLNNSTLLKEKGLLEEIRKLTFDRNTLFFQNISLNSYFVSPVADFLHMRLILAHRSFSFETVMSHPNKVHVLQRAHDEGYRNYLYFVATEDPDINISRVKIRVREGGHDVPEKKIRERYRRSLNNLLDAVKASDRAYIFDNSGAEAFLVAEITDGKDIEIKNSNVPVWFSRHVLDKGT